MNTDAAITAPQGCSEPGLCPLTHIKAGACARIRRFSVPPDVAQRLREIGLSEDRQVRLVSSQRSVICMVCNSRLAISTDLAESILVEPDAAPA
ncbi:MAG: ferrous iron transport protein A [Verrucomicrobia bacterium]|nr:ferrous iron transport protein A [Verrucomicrobiota bacterium]